MKIDLLGWDFILFVGLLVPWLAIRSAQKLRGGTPFPSRKRYVLSTIILQILIGLFAIWTARSNWIQLFPAVELRLRDVLVAAVVLALAIGTVPWRWKGMSPEPRARLGFLIPHHPHEHALFWVLTLLAGICEELAYRGVLFTLLWRVLGNPWLAAILSALSFGVAHMVQGWRSAITIVVFGLIFQGLAALSGALYLSMAVHIVYDLAAISLYARYLRRAEVSAAA